MTTAHFIEQCLIAVLIRSPPPSPPRSPLRTQGGAEYQELPQVQTAQQWPLKHDTVWSQELFDEYVHKTPAAVPGIKKASPLRLSRVPPRSPGPPSLSATQELPISPNKPVVKPSLDYDANVQRSLVIAESLQAKQQQQLEAVERRLQSDEKKLRNRIEKRLQEVACHVLLWPLWLSFVCRSRRSYMRPWQKTGNNGSAEPKKIL